MKCTPEYMLFLSIYIYIVNTGLNFGPTLSSITPVSNPYLTTKSWCRIMYRHPCNFSKMLALMTRLSVRLERRPM